MKKSLKSIVIASAILTFAAPSVHAQLDLSRLLSGAQKAIQAFTLSDDQINAYVSEYIQHSDSTNKVLPETSPYTIRLRTLTAGITEVENTPLNFKVYEASDVNAFACADGSVRVYTALMDIMDDNELLGVIGHEIGHVAHRDSRKAFQTALMTSALKDGLASRGGVVAQLTDSQLGELGEALVNARYSQKQENNADDYGYDFLKKHGKNPAAMAVAFKKLKQLEGENAAASNMVNQLFSSHPQLEKRIERMEKKCQKDGYDAETLKGKTQTDYNVTTSASKDNKSGKTSKSTKSSKSSKSTRSTKSTKSTQTSKTTKTTKSSKSAKSTKSSKK